MIKYPSLEKLILLASHLKRDKVYDYVRKSKSTTDVYKMIIETKNDLKIKK